MKISQTFVAFSEYMNFTYNHVLGRVDWYPAGAAAAAAVQPASEFFFEIYLCGTQKIFPFIRFEITLTI